MGQTYSGPRNSTKRFRSSSRSSSRRKGMNLAESDLVKEVAADEAEEQNQPQEEEEEAADFTLVLPDELLGLIFDRLDTRCRNAASLVCRRWLLAEAFSRRNLSLSAPAALPISCLRSTLLRFAGLQKLGLRCNRGSPSVTDDALHVVAAYCSHLVKLKLKNCVALTNSGLEAFAAAVRSTSFRSFSCCSCGFGARGLNALILHCSALEDLSVKKLRLGGGVGQASDYVSGPSNLKRLSIKHIMDSGLAFVPLIATSKQLHTLIIFKVSGQWDKLLEFAVVEGLKELTELRMERIYLGDTGLQAVAKCRNLQVLFLARTPDCTNVGIAAIASGCRSLRKLHVDGCFSGRIGDKGLVSIAEKCPELKELVLIGLCATSDSLNLLFSNCVGLERLALWNSETFGDRELGCIAKKCRALRKLCIKCCPISDKGLEALAGGCPSLSKLKIKKCRGVSVAGTSMLMMSHIGLVITLETDPAAVIMEQYSQQQNQQQQQQQQQMLQLPPPTANANAAASFADPSVRRSPFARARSAIVAALDSGWQSLGGASRRLQL